MLETPLVVVCAWVLPSTTTIHTNEATPNDDAKGLPIMADRTPIRFLRVKSRCKPSDVLRAAYVCQG